MKNERWKHKRKKINYCFMKHKYLLLIDKSVSYCNRI